jgi:O-antigen ligase
VTIIYCTLQSFGLGQFFKTIDSPYIKDADPIVGFLGNPTIIAGYLGMCAPLLLFLRKRLMFLSLILVVSLMFKISIPPPATGILAIMVTMGYVLFRFNKKVLYSLLTIAILCTLLIPKLIPKNFAYDNDRISHWKKYYEIGKDKFITGNGLGSVNIISNQIDKTIIPFRYLHNEFIHFNFEIGFIGLLIIAWGILDALMRKSDLVPKALFLGFLVNCLTLFPAHLWVMSTLGMFCYAAIYTKEKKCKLCQK